MTMIRLIISIMLLALTAAGLARDPAAIEFRNADLQTVTLAEVIAAESLTLLNFWASWCPPCRDELPLLLEAELGPDITLHAVNVGERPARVENYLASNNLGSLPVLYLTARNSALLPIPGMPSSLLIDQQGNILTTHYGAFSAESLDSFLAEWSPNQ